MEAFLESNDALYVIYVGVALGVFLAFTGIIQILSRSENAAEARSRRMKMIEKGATTEEILEVLKPRDSGGRLTRLPFIGNFERDLQQAGLIIKPKKFVLVCMLLTFGTVVVGLTMANAYIALGTGFLIGMFLPVVWVKSKAKERMKKLTMQLPDALDLLARGLRVGHPLNTSVQAVAAEMPDPVGTEFGIIFDQVSFGDDLTDAFVDFSSRVDLEDVHYLSASVGIQHGTGGDLARVVAILSQVIRARIALRNKIKAISAEGRMTAWILSIIPVFIFTWTMITTPNYYRGVMDDPLFIPAAAFIITCVVLNALILRKLVNFRI
ncbi:type II secretion system F family protein [Ovoidimarina sediminis]|uniref:type II secretion system F family protein n=1 Tax=Ovoidimarina sediminis TaxID=3079856 RepID=UPI002912E991|nr:type II secretion system F family protein [Rhodophyticola sp. MJ-SS7]MDU8946032.1 type II secretion system F family protein [Rhodophyticola sp. MJ-SS7]